MDTTVGYADTAVVSADRIVTVCNNLTTVSEVSVPASRFIANLMYMYNRTKNSVILVHEQFAAQEE